MRDEEVEMVVKGVGGVLVNVEVKRGKVGVRDVEVQHGRVLVQVQHVQV